MKIYQLCFPDGDGYPVVPKITWLNIPTIEEINNFFQKEYKKYKEIKNYRKQVQLINLNIDEYNKLISGNEINKPEIYGYSYGTSIMLEEVEVIENT